MAFSIFSKKEEPPKRPVAAPARAQPVTEKKPATSAPIPQTRAQTAAQLNQKIDQIEAEMEDFTLDFTSPAPARYASAPPAPVAAVAVASAPPPAPVEAAALPQFDTPAASPTSAPLPEVAPVAGLAAAPLTAPLTAPVTASIAAPVPAPTATSAPAIAAPPDAAPQRAKPVIERGFNPTAPSARSVRPAAPGKFAAPAAHLLTTPKPGLAQPAPTAAPAAAAEPQAAAPLAPAAVSITPARPAPPATSASAQPAPAQPVAAKASPAAPAKPAPSKSGYPAGVASVMMMEVEQSPFAAAPVLEEAAILYANGQDLVALAALSDALQNAKMPKNAARQAYSLLFDLYENMGRPDEFDNAAVEFAVRFETSPPAYNDRSSVKDPMLATGSGQYFALAGTLDVSSEKLFAQLTKIAERSKILRIEFGKIAAVAEAGCKLLLSHLTGFKKSGHDLVFSSSEHLIALLNGAIETGRRADPEVYWLLLLELYQFQSMQAAFEETALNYCITYEVSPPSWAEPAKAASSTPPVNGPATLDVPQDAMYLKGEMAGPSDLLFNDIAAYAGGKSRVVIDMFAVKRIDFIAAGAFLNTVQNLRGTQKEIELRSPSPLLAALLVSMGFLNHVRLTRRGS